MFLKSMIEMHSFVFAFSSVFSLELSHSQQFDRAPTKPTLCAFLTRCLDVGGTILISMCMNAWL